MANKDTEKRINIGLGDDSQIFVKFPGESEYTQIEHATGIPQEQDNTVDSWVELGDGGYYSNLKIGQNLGFGFNIVRRIGDEAHNKLIDLSFKNGKDTIVGIKIVGPNETLTGNATADITNSGITAEAQEKLIISGVFRIVGAPEIEDGGYADEVRMFKVENDKK